MTLPYGILKGKVTSVPTMKSSRHNKELQYHLHFNIDVQGSPWDVAVNVGTNDSDDLLKYKLVYDFQHPIIQTLKAAANGTTDLTDTDKLPALDFQRSDVLDNTGKWRDSGVMDGSEGVEPAASLNRLLRQAKDQGFDVYVIGRFYTDGDGIHDVHMNQGSKGGFIHVAGSDSNDHNDIWQDGAVIVDVQAPEWAAYFTAFDQQWVPTDDLGNPTPASQPMS